MNNSKIIAYTDGACKGNPGIGGWGALLSYKGISKEFYGAEKDTTNNRMEMMAAIQTLKALKRKCDITIYTDSVYLKNGVQQWMPNWIKKGWKTSNNKDVKNKDLWIQLNELIKQHNITWKWVKGHSGNSGNEKADELANKAVEEFRNK